MLTRVGILGLTLFYCMSGLANAQQSFGGASHCSQCNSSTMASALSTDTSTAYANAVRSYDNQLPTYSAATSRYVVASQAMMPAISQQPGYSIQYQQQAIVRQVPVTTFQNLTVDRGSYQTVWVPRPVTQQIAQTTIQSQVNYHTVAVPMAHGASLAYGPAAQTIAIASPTMQPLYSTQTPSMVFSPSVDSYSTAMAPRTATVPMIAADPRTYSGTASDQATLPLLPSVDPSYATPQYSTGPTLKLPDTASTQSPVTVVPGTSDSKSTSSASREYERPTENRRARGMFEPVNSSSSIWRGRYTSR
jgi:hypothetical protein